MFRGQKRFEERFGGTKERLSRGVCIAKFAERFAGTNKRLSRGGFLDMFGERFGGIEEIWSSV